ncbi:MAG: FkbM family methyltransferase [Croceibacterium sp.]
MDDLTETSPRKVIYDLGSHVGDDIPYYLLKADMVVAVEANPLLIERIYKRFPREIAAQRLKVENCALTVEPGGSDVRFFIHKTQDVLSQLDEPEHSERANFNEIQVPSMPLIELIQRHGDPYYVKIDLEGFDNKVLAHLFANGIFPPYISAEAHSAEVFCSLVALGGYRAFKLVAGPQLAWKYPRHLIKVGDAQKVYEFPYPDSSGPFGNDIKGRWMTPDDFMRYLAYVGTGWVDVHASRVDRPTPQRVRLLAEIGSRIARETGVRLRLTKLQAWSDKLWGAN